MTCLKRSGLWCGTASKPQGLEAGVQFKELLNTSTVAVNKAGQVAIYGLYTDDRTGLYPSGIWAQDTDGVLQMIVHNGQELELAPGDRRTINYVWTYGEDSGLEDGHQSWFNEAGQVVFGARFTDNSEGIFVSNAVAIPEPNTIIMAVLGFVALLIAAHRSHLCRCNRADECRVGSDHCA